MLNECRFIGNVTRKPEIGVTEGGVKYARFTVACNERGRRRKDGTETPDRVEYIPCTAWRNVADYLERFVDRGQLLLVCGKFHAQQYDDADGHKQYYSDIQANHVQNLNNNRRAGTPPPVEPTQHSNTTEDPF